MLIASRNGFAVDGGALPYDAEVEYLESTGTQWIDTGLRASNGFGYSISFAITSRGGVNDNTMYFCGYGSEWNRGIALCEDISSSIGIRGIYGANNCPLTTIHTVVGTRYDVIVTANPFTMTISGGASFSASYVPGSAFSGTQNFAVFKGPYNRNYTALNPKGMRLFGFVLMDVDKNVVRNMIPVRVGTVGYMYDRVSGELFGNAGAGAFVIGPDL